MIYSPEIASQIAALIAENFSHEEIGEKLGYNERQITYVLGRARAAGMQIAARKPERRISRVEREIERLLDGGGTQSSIAAHVGLSVRTASYHIRKIRDRQALSAMRTAPTPAPVPAPKRPKPVVKATSEPYRDRIEEIKAEIAGAWRGTWREANGGVCDVEVSV